MQLPVSSACAWRSGTGVQALAFVWREGRSNLEDQLMRPACLASLWRGGVLAR